MTAAPYWPLHRIDEGEGRSKDEKRHILILYGNAVSHGAMN